jgi:hypothetical protein
MNVIYISIIAFSVILLLVHCVKPTMVYAPDGSLRQFGIGYRHKTVVPLWFIVLLTSAVSYAVAYNFY